MKKLIAMLLCLVTVMSLLAGCGGKKEPQSTNGGTDDPDGQIKLKIGVLEHVNCESYEDNAFTKWLEEQTGYKLEFERFASSASDAKTQLSTKLATEQELPDIIWNLELGASTYKVYGEDEYFLDLAPYYNDREKSATFWERLEELPEDYQELILRRLTDKETGAMYVFPHAEYTLIDTMDYQVYINQQWLDQLGLSMPKSAEELYDVLVAFRDKDPNGNGQRDEIPLVGATGSLSGDVVNWLTNMFTYVDDSKWWNVDENGQLFLPYTTDEYRQALIYINKLVSEGLMPDSCWSMNYKDAKALINTTDSVAKVGIWVGHPSLVAEIGNDVLHQYEALPVWGNAVVNANQFNRKTFITTSCKNPDAAWNLLMLMCSKEGSLRMRYGEKGVDWVEADPGAKSFLGSDAEIKVINSGASTTQGRECWKTISATILVNAEYENVQVFDDSDPWTQKKMQIMSDCYWAYEEARKNNPKVLVPELIYTQEELDATEFERTNCRSYLTQMRSNFCVGINNPNDDKAWNDYLNELNTLGREVWQNQAQEIYEQQLAS